MFLESSRYHNLPVEVVTSREGREITVLRPRRLPERDGQAKTITAHDRLDILSDERYGSPTGFWVIADANSELEANRLVAEPGRTIEVPDHD